MKRKLAIWLLKQFPCPEMRKIVIESLEGLPSVRKREFIEGMLPPGQHIHTNPKKKVTA